MDTMSAVLKELFEVNALRFAHEFLATITMDRESALKLMHSATRHMEEWEVRQWLDYLGELVIEEGVSAEQLHSILIAIESLDNN